MWVTFIRLTFAQSSRPLSVTGFSGWFALRTIWCPWHRSITRLFIPPNSTVWGLPTIRSSIEVAARKSAKRPLSASAISAPNSVLAVASCSQIERNSFDSKASSKFHLFEPSLNAWQAEKRCKQETKASDFPHTQHRCLQHSSKFARLWVIGVGENHQHVVRDEPLSSSSKSRETPRPDVAANGFLTHSEVNRGLGYCELLWHRHDHVPSIT